jgi:hypothetical protein
MLQVISLCFAQSMRYYFNSIWKTPVVYLVRVLIPHVV